jgi:hypothetical protein
MPQSRFFLFGVLIALGTSSLCAGERAGKDWWSLQPLRDVAPPSADGVPSEWSKTPIDRFVHRRLSEKQLQPGTTADRRTLIRRVTFDLLGLPPSPEEIDALVNDTRPDAYELLVDRLLDSPHYGERWGRHWLDVVRFGESRGYEQNHIRDNAWPYRDYVIQAFNDDMPYDRFILEQLAGDQLIGDEVDPEDRNAIVATSFLVNGPYDTVGNGDLRFLRQIRANAVNDFVATTASTFLGLTFHCARCHDHKFDPILQKDYYSLAAAFDGVQHGGRSMATAEESRRLAELVRPIDEEIARRRAELEAFEKAVESRVAEQRDEILARYRPPVDATGTEESFTPVDARFVRMVIEDTSGGIAKLEEFAVWTSDPSGNSRNVALASAGASAAAVSTAGSDGADVFYSADLLIDGEFGACWISGTGRSGEFTIELARTERVSRILWSRSRDVGYRSDPPTVYSIQASLDGKEWREVAHSRDRRPYTEAAVDEAVLRKVLTSEENARRGELKRHLAEAEARRAAVPGAEIVNAAELIQPTEPLYFLKGGDVMSRGDAMPAASPSTLAHVLPGFELPVDAPEGKRRLTLARWIADRRNPLTARVIVNRIWHYHFGRGIVATPSDFGVIGVRPTHPDLLDWLARRLQDLDWRLKAFHKEIVLSATYRQSSQFVESNGAIDRDAVYLWRFPPRRLEAEEIRDSVLAVAGKLDARMGGPGFRLYRYTVDNVATYYPLKKFGPETYRRAVYHQNVRAVKVELLGQFDCPDNALPAPRRESTISPLQALGMLNSSFVVDLARFFGERLARDVGDDPGAQVRRAYGLAFGRAPQAEEESMGVKLIETHGLTVFCRVLLNANEFIHVM